MTADTVIRRVPLLLAMLVLAAAAFAQDPATGSSAYPTWHVRSPLNEDLPKWLTVGAQVRFREESQRGENFTGGNSDNYFYQRYRFAVGIKPSSWISFFGEMQDSRAPGAAIPNATQKDKLDIRQAYVDIGHPEGGLWDLQAGRIILAYGTERLIGASDWTNTARVFDGVKLNLHWGKDRLDLFSASVVNNNPLQWDHHQDGNNLHGMYGSLASLLPHAHVEPFLLVRTAPGYKDSFGIAGKYLSYTYGTRVIGAVGPAIDYESQVAGQYGNIVNDRLSAWTAMSLVNYHFLRLRSKPYAGAEYNFASGDSRPGDHTVNTFDQLYPTNHSKYGYADELGLRNMHNVRTGAGFRPLRWLDLSADHHWFWLASRYDGLYNASGRFSVAPVAGGFQYTDVGREADLQAKIQLSKYYSIGSQFGYIFPGQFLKTYSPGANRTFFAFWLDFRI